MVREPTLRRGQTVRIEDSSGELQGEPEISTNRIYRWRLEPVRTSGRSKLIYFIYRHHNEPRVQFYVLKEKTFPIQLKYFDVTRSTQTDLAVLEKKRVDDYWNFDSNRSLSDSWKGSTKFFLLKEKSPKGYMWSEEWLTKIQTTARQDHVWPKVWTLVDEAAQNREKQVEKRKAQSRQCSKTERNLLYWFWWPTLQWNFGNTRSWWQV